MLSNSAKSVSRLARDAGAYLSARMPWTETVFSQVFRVANALVSVIVGVLGVIYDLVRPVLAPLGNAVRRRSVRRRSARRFAAIAADRELQFYTLIFSAFYLFIIFFILFDYSRLWTEPEYVSKYYPALRDNGLRGTLDAWNIGDGRPRFFTNFLMYLNIEFRSWFSNFLFPHPTLSVNWIIALILCPYFMYKFVYLTTGERAPAFNSALLLLVAPGVMNGVMHFYTPAKPLANLFTILTIYGGALLYASRMSPRLREKKNWIFALVFFSILLGYFSDETAYFAVVVLFILAPGLFMRFYGMARLAFFQVTWSVNIQNTLLVVAPFVVFIILVTFIVPPIQRAMDMMPLQFWEFVLKGPANAIEGTAGEPLGLHLKFSYIVANFYSMLSSHVVPFREILAKIYSQIAIGFGDPNNWGPKEVASFVALFAFAVFSVIQLPAKSRGLALRFGVAFFVFVVFQSFVWLRGIIIFPNVMWYGTMSSVFLAPFIGILLFSRSRALDGVFKVFLVLMAVNFMANSLDINDTYRRLANWRITVCGDNVHCFREMDEKKPQSLYSVLAVWRQRDNEQAIHKLKKGAPAQQFWLFREIDGANARKKGKPTQLGFMEEGQLYSLLPYKD